VENFGCMKANIQLISAGLFSGLNGKIPGMLARGYREPINFLREIIIN